MSVIGRGAAIAVWFSCFGLAACGGGGSGGGSQSGPSMSLSTTQVSVSAKTTDPAPTATVRITVTNPPQGTLYVGYQATDNGIDSISLSSSSKTTADITIQFKSPAQLGKGVYNDNLTLAVCLDDQCADQIANSPQTVSVQYTVAETALTLTSIAPDSAAPGSGAFTLTANGAGFVEGSTVHWNGNALQTDYVSASQLTAQVPGTDVEDVGTASVTVVNPPPDGRTSDPLSFTIQYGTPSIAKLFPNGTVEDGPAFTLTIVGAGFGPESQVQWNGDARTTSFVSATEVTARIAAADIATTETATVAVINPSPGGGSDSKTFTIRPYTSDAVAFQIDADHSGVMNFDPVSFPDTSSWSTDVGGTPSYAVIADGKVFVTVNVNRNSRLLALDQKTGAVVWGPISLPGAANAAYDAGSIFVVSGNVGNADVMQALDADTGSPEWSTELIGQYDFTAGPTALNGFVYTGGAGVGGTIYAVGESDGVIAWTGEVANGDDSTPALTADGLYVTYPCQTYDFRPGTGDLVWHDVGDCEGGGGATPVVANGRLYAPNGFGTYNGSVFDAETGQLTGSYVADNPPAIAKGDGYFLQDGILYDIDLATNNIVWGFAGDGHLDTSPIVINQYVIVGSSWGNVYALDAATGNQVWTADVGAAIPPGAGWGAGMPLSGLSAGHGLLIVPAGNSVTAYRLASD